MADVTIFKSANVTVEVIDGNPPVDQSALVAQLQAENAALQSKIDAAKAAAEADKAADAANVAGQGVLDALN